MDLDFNHSTTISSKMGKDVSQQKTFQPLNHNKLKNGKNVSQQQPCIHPIQPWKPSHLSGLFLGVLGAEKQPRVPTAPCDACSFKAIGLLATQMMLLMPMRVLQMGLSSLRKQTTTFRLVKKEHQKEGLLFFCVVFEGTFARVLQIPQQA